MAVLSKAVQEAVSIVGRQLLRVLDGSIGFTQLFNTLFNGKTVLFILLTNGVKLYDLLKKLLLATAPQLFSTFTKKFLGYQNASKVKCSRDMEILKQYNEKNTEKINEKLRSDLEAEKNKCKPTAGNAFERLDAEYEHELDFLLRDMVQTTVMDCYSAEVAKFQRSEVGEVTLETPLETVPDWSIEDCLIPEEYIEPHHDKVISAKLLQMETRAEKAVLKIERELEREKGDEDALEQETIDYYDGEELVSREQARKVKKDAFVTSVMLHGEMNKTDRQRMAVLEISNNVSSAVWGAKRKCTKVPRPRCLPMLRKAIINTAKVKFFPVGNDAIDILSARRAVEEVCKNYNVSMTYTAKMVKELPPFVATPDGAEMCAAMIFAGDESRQARWKRAALMSH